MAATTLASVDDLSDWIGEPIESEADTKRATMCLRIASALVRDESENDWDEGTVPDSVAMVTLYCASRVYENREAENQSSLDDWQASRQVLESGAYLTATEKRMLAKYNRPKFGGLGVIATTRAETVPVSGWVPTNTPDVQFPWY